jgi:hypothetical protein
MGAPQMAQGASGFFDNADDVFVQRRHFSLSQYKSSLSQYKRQPYDDEAVWRREASVNLSPQNTLEQAASGLVLSFVAGAACRGH